MSSDDGHGDRLSRLGFRGGLGASRSGHDGCARGVDRHAGSSRCRRACSANAPASEVGGVLAALSSQSLVGVSPPATAGSIQELLNRLRSRTDSQSLRVLTFHGRRETEATAAGEAMCQASAPGCCCCAASPTEPAFFLGRSLVFRTESGRRERGGRTVRNRSARVVDVRAMAGRLVGQQGAPKGPSYTLMLCARGGRPSTADETTKKSAGSPKATMPSRPSKYVSDEIAALFDPTPEGDFDPEADVAADDAARVIAEGDFAADGPEFESRGTLRMRGGMDEVDARYPSKPISRKRWERQFAGTTPTRAPPAEASRTRGGGGDESGSERDGAEEGGEDEEGRGADDGFGARADGSCSESEPEGGAGDGDGPNGAVRPKAGSLQAEWLKLQAEEAELARKLASDAREDVRRATEAAAQHAAWEQVFNIRILLHKALAAANQAPDPALQPHFAAHSAQARVAYAEAARSARLLLADMLTLNGALGAPAVGSGGADGAASAPELERIASAPADAEPTELVAAGWLVACAQSGPSLAAHLRSLDEWSAKAGLSSVPGSERKFKAFQRSIGEQVDAALAEPARALARAHTVRSGRRPLGLRPAPGIGAPRALADGEEVRCLHVYDDTDLYHAQLKVRAPPEPGARRARQQLCGVLLVFNFARVCVWSCAHQPGARRPPPAPALAARRSLWTGGASTRTPPTRARAGSRSSGGARRLTARRARVARSRTRCTPSCRTSCSRSRPRSPSRCTSCSRACSAQPRSRSACGWRERH